MFKSLLFLNGILPESDFANHWPEAILMAADGAGSKLIKQGRHPHLIVGDQDSFLGALTLPDIEKIQLTEQDSTDFMKCLHVLSQRELFPTLICGIGGGEIDHALYNIETFVDFAKQHPMMFYDEQKGYPAKLGFVVNSYVDLKFSKLSQTVSLIPFPKAKLTSSGLSWAINNETLEIFNKSGVRNNNNELTVTIKVESGLLLVIIDALHIEHITWEQGFASF